MSAAVVEDVTRSKSIVDGKLMFISPSLLSKFDDDAKYGCERAGFFEYVLGKKSPPNFKMTRGTYLASMQEEYLKTGKLLLGNEDQTRWFKKLIPHLDKHRASGRVIGIERAVERLLVAGVPVHPNSKSDLVLTGPAEIEDLKTTGDIEKNGKSVVQLRKDTQLVLYAKEFHPDAPEVKLTHSYLQLEGSLIHRPVSATVSQSDIDKVIGGTIVPLVERVKSLVGEKDVKAIPRANQSKCFRCAHRGYCPPEKENPLMSILDKFKPKSAADAQKVTPPDAPPSTPPGNAKDVEGFKAIPPSRAEVLAAAKKITDVSDADIVKEDDGLDDEERAALAAIRKKKAEKQAKEQAAAEAKAAEEKRAAAATVEAARQKANKAAEESAAGESEEEKEVRKSKGGRPPGSLNKPKQLNPVTAKFYMVMNLGVEIGRVDFGCELTDYCEPDEMSDVYDALMDLCKEKVHAEAAKFNAAAKK